jgi:hypothetical protein
VQVHRRQSECGCEHCRDHQDEIDPCLKCRQTAEPLLERDGEQEPREDLSTGLSDSQLLQDLVPVTVHPLVEGLVAAVRWVNAVDSYCRVIAHRLAPVPAAMPLRPPSDRGIPKNHRLHTAGRRVPVLPLHAELLSVRNHVLIKYVNVIHPEPSRRFSSDVHGTSAISPSFTMVGYGDHYPVTAAWWHACMIPAF